VQRLVDKARARGRFAILTLTSEDEPLRDELLGLAISLPDESVYVPLGHRAAGSGGSGALFAPAEINARRAIPLLKPLLEDPGIIKDGHDLKRTSMPGAASASISKAWASIRALPRT